MNYNKSPLKWAGSKNKALYHLLPIIEAYKFDTLIEPFVGAANVSLNVECDNYVWNDANVDLMNTLETILGDSFVFDAFMHITKELFERGSKDYTQIRNVFNEEKLYTAPCMIAAMFLYLNKHCFNGLCRYNTKGIFNVPVGTISEKSIPLKAIQTMREMFRYKVATHNDDFTTIFHKYKNDKSVLIYNDPPYVPLTSNFKYTKGGFNLDDQLNLKNACKESPHTCIISNHWTEFTEELYSDADRIKTFEVQRTISCKGDERKKVQECIVVYNSH